MNISVTFIERRTDLWWTGLSLRTNTYLQSQNTTVILAVGREDSPGALQKCANIAVLSRNRIRSDRTPETPMHPRGVMLCGVDKK